MRFLLPLLAAGLAACPMPVQALGMQRDREQTGAYRAMQQGRVLSLTEIRTRVRVPPGAQYIGVEILEGMIYRLKFMRGADVIWIDVDPRTGRVVARTGR